MIFLSFSNKYTFRRVSKQFFCSLSTFSLIICSLYQVFTVQIQYIAAVVVQNNACIVTYLDRFSLVFATVGRTEPFEVVFQRVKISAL